MKQRNHISRRHSNRVSQNAGRRTLWGLALVAGVAFPALGGSTTYTWTGAGGTGAFSDSSNWDATGVPQTHEKKSKDDVLRFPTLTDGAQTLVELDQDDGGGAQNLARFDFTADAPAYTFVATGARHYDLWGDSSSLALVQGSAATQTFKQDVALRKPVGFDLVAGDADFLGSLVLRNEGKALAVTGSHDLALSQFRNDTGTSATFTMNGTGTTTFRGTVTELTQINVNSGTLRLAGNDLIADTPSSSGRSSLALGGGTLDTGGHHADFLGKLTLTANSQIDFGHGSSILAFQSDGGSGASSLGGSVLTISNWSGSLNVGGGTDQLIFGALSGHTVGGVYNDIVFSYGGNLLPSTLIASPNPAFAGQFEVIPVVPEPATLVGLLALFGLVACRERERLKLAWVRAWPSRR